MLQSLPIAYNPTPTPATTWSCPSYSGSPSLCLHTRSHYSFDQCRKIQHQNFAN